jgi:hypothetical protein
MASSGPTGWPVGLRLSKSRVVAEGIFGQDAGVAGVVRVGGGVSLFDAPFLADEFEGVPQDGDAEDARRQWTVSGDQ